MLIETETPTQTLENKPNLFKNLFSDINLDNLIELEELTLLLLQEKKNSDEKAIEELSAQESDQEENYSSSNNLLTKFVDDLILEKDEVFTRIDLLIGTAYKEKLKEIISRLKEENRGKQ